MKMATIRIVFVTLLFIGIIIHITTPASLVLYALAISTVSAAFAGILGLNSLLNQKENNNTYYQVASFFSGIILFTEFVSRISNGSAMPYEAYVSTLFRFLAVFIILSATLVGIVVTNYRRHIISVIALCFLFTFLSIYILFLGQDIHLLYNDHVLSNFRMLAMFTTLVLVTSLYLMLFFSYNKNKLYTIEILSFGTLLFLSSASHMLFNRYSGAQLFSNLSLMAGLLILLENSLRTNIIIPMKMMHDQKQAVFQIFDHASDPVILFEAVEEDRHIRYANKAASKLCGYDLDEFSNISLRNLFVSPTSLDEMIDNFSKTKELELKNKDADPILCLVSVDVFDLFGFKERLLIARDISSMKEQKAQLDVFDAIFTKSNESMFITDSKGFIKWVNESFTEIYGYEKHEIIGQSTRILSSGIHDKDFYAGMWKSIESSGSWIGEIWNKSKFDYLIPVHESIIKIPGHDPNYQYASISIDLTESKLLDQKIYELAYMDPETNLKNKNALLEFQAESSMIAIVLIRLSNYHNIRLRFGEGISTRLFYNIVSEVQAFRSSFEVYRYDENTLAIILNDIPKRYIEEFSEELLQATSAAQEVEKILLNPTVAIGVSSAHEEEDNSFQRSLFEGESALREAEKKKYSNVMFFDPSIENNIMESFDFRAAVSKAIEDGEFTVHFQPIIDTYTGELFSLEALARWYIDGEYVSPAKFIPEAESSNDIYSLGLQIMEKSCMHIMSWKHILPGLKLSVNISLLQLENGSFVDTIKDILERTNFSPSDLILEITESVSLQDNKIIEDTIIELHNLGITFALDDFGTGFSSIHRLKNMPISIVKIDKGFIENIDESIDDTSVVTGMISMSHRIGLDVIAEGVENNEQFQILRNRNCRYVQGYLFSKPLSIEDTEAYLNRYDSEKLSDNAITANLKDYEAIEEYRVSSKEVVGSCILDLSGVVIDCNINFGSIIGERKQEIIGENINTFIKSDTLKSLDPRTFDTDLIEESGYIRRIDGTIRYIVFSLYSDLDQITSSKYVRCFIEDITENLNEELRILRIRQGYEKIFHNAPVMILTWDLDYRIQEWNDLAAEVFGLHFDDVKQKSLFDVIVPESEEKDWKHIMDQAIGGNSSISTLKAMDSDGSIHICECHNDIVRTSSGEIDFVVTILHDITETELAQAKSDSLLSIIDNGPALVFMCHVDGSIVYRSQACLEFDHLKDIRNIDDLRIKHYDPLDNELPTPIREEVEIWSSTGCIHIAENNERRVHVTLFKDKVSELQDEVFVYIFMDYTTEYEQIQSVAALKNILVDQERLAELGQLSAGIAHEINNPLSYMISSSDVLKTELKEMYNIISTSNKEEFDYLQSDINEILEEFDEGLERIKTIVTGLRTYSWSGPADEFMPFDLNQCIDKVLTIAHNEIKYSANVMLNLTEIPLVEAIGSKISQVILNLIINASHAIQKKHEGDMGDLTISTSSDNSYIYCVIEDTGIGMKEDVKAQIFEAFFTTKPEGVGTGLGLSISKEIIQDLHHGSITCDSEFGVGTKFTIALPLHQPHAPEN